MVRVWLYGGGGLCEPLADLLRAGPVGQRNGERGWVLRYLAGRLLRAGGTSTHCSPGPPAGQAADSYAEQELGSALQRLGGLDALVYVVDPNPAGPVMETTRRVAGGFLACAREAVRSMANGRVAGNLVCVCDIAGLAGRSGRAAAASASGALMGMVRALAKEVGRQQIAVNALACGPMAIPGQATQHLTEHETELFQAMGIGQPLQPEELAATLSLLVRGGHGMTGQVLRLDHGLVF